MILISPAAADGKKWGQVSFWTSKADVRLCLLSANWLLAGPDRMDLTPAYRTGGRRGHALRRSIV